MSFLEHRDAAEALLVALAAGERPNGVGVEVRRTAATVVRSTCFAVSPVVAEMRDVTAGMHLLTLPDLDADNLDALCSLCRDGDFLAAYVAHPSVTDELRLDAVWFYVNERRSALPFATSDPLLRVAAALSRSVPTSASGLHGLLAEVLSATDATIDVFVTLLGDAGNTGVAQARELLAVASAVAVPLASD